MAFLPRTAAIDPGCVAVIHGERRITYQDFHARARRLLIALALALRVSEVTDRTAQCARFIASIRYT
ncbi:MAG: hypothetical protein DMD91_27945 [Candidatus Rokuibacteriota bacterium]|nr:MAG: hypothetical protein DMD91_27945 [Candidatus Rokubacteria bacterium]